MDSQHALAPSVHFNPSRLDYILSTSVVFIFFYTAWSVLMLRRLLTKRTVVRLLGYDNAKKNKSFFDRQMEKVLLFFFSR